MSGALISAKNRIDVLEFRKIRNVSLAEEDLKAARPVCRGLPVRVTVSDTTACNLNCFMCPRAIFSIPGKNMSLALFKKVSRQLFADAAEITLSVIGEPFSNPNLKKELDQVEKAKAKLIIFTNGLLLPENELLERLCKSLFTLFISVNSASPGVYRSIHRGGSFPALLRSIERFNLARNRLPRQERPLLGLSFILMKSNIEDLVKFINLAHRVGAERIIVSHAVIFSEALKGESLFFDKTLANKEIIAARKIAEKLKIEVLDFPAPFNVAGQKAKFKDEVVVCKFPWKMVFIEVSGDVYPCCAPNREGLLMGNIAKDNFSSIWNGPKYRALRKSFAENNLRLACKKCYLRLKNKISDDNRIFFPDAN